MAIKQKKISAKVLVPGMYVSRLDRPWIETPFPIQGFNVRSDEQIAKIQEYCKHVFVDESLSKVPNKDKTQFRVVHASSQQVTNAESNDKSGGTSVIQAVISRGSINDKSKTVQSANGKVFRPVVYESNISTKEEVVSIKKTHAVIEKAAAVVFRSIQEGRVVDFFAVKSAASEVVGSVIRNPDAMLWMSRVRDKSEYTYMHSMRSSIWASVFGRYLGLPKAALETLALGVMLSDVGKAKLPKELVNKPGAYTDHEYEEIKRHVPLGVEILKTLPECSDQLINIVQNHHERHDGSGYPGGLAGTKIPMMARIAGIVDVYDAMTNDRPYAKAIPSADAVATLYAMRDKQFQSKMVEQFIQAIGIYPTGTLVELSNNEVGVVVGQNPERRLRPKIMILLSDTKKRLWRKRYRDLLVSLRDEKGNDLLIARSLVPGAYNINMERLKVG